MSSSERQELEEQRLQEEIVELRGELGETVEALVHKADLPARAKERGAELTAELTERAVDRGVELHQQVTERGSELSQEATERWNEVKAQGNEVKAQVLERGRELREQAFGAAERTREAVSQTPPDRWVKLACAGLALVALMVIVRRVRVR